MFRIQSSTSFWEVICLQSYWKSIRLKTSRNNSKTLWQSAHVYWKKQHFRSATFLFLKKLWINGQNYKTSGGNRNSIKLEIKTKGEVKKLVNFVFLYQPVNKIDKFFQKGKIIPQSCSCYRNRRVWDRGPFRGINS